jgi:branched-chain amino acid transport system ATP-binding protein
VVTTVLLEVEKVSKNFGGVQALKGVSIKVDKGKIYGLIGPNGSGKTTLFKVIAGILRPSSGVIKFNGERINGKPPHIICQKGIAITFQIVRVFPDLTVLENVKVGLLGNKKNLNAKFEDKAVELLDFIGLNGKTDWVAKNLTLAERKKLDLARALATSPQLLLLDEFMAGLNPKEMAGELELIRKIKDRGVTVIMVEHVMRAVMAISEWIFVLNFGELISEGRLEKYQTMKK